MKDDALLNAADTIQRLKASGNPFVQYLFQLFSNPADILHLISDCHGECRLYTYGTMSFATLADVRINFSYEEETKTYHEETHYQASQYQNGQAEGHTHQEQHGKTKTADGPVVKPYGDSWFSLQAHRDIKKLKEEYHALAKQYHPDRCQHSRSKEIFQEILNERAVAQRIEKLNLYQRKDNPRRRKNPVKQSDCLCGSCRL